MLAEIDDAIVRRRGRRSRRNRSCWPARPLRPRARIRSPLSPSRCSLLIVLAALFGPCIVPYDPLATQRRHRRCSRPPGSTGSAPISSAATCSRRVVVATRLDLVDRRRCGRACRS